MYRYDEFDHAFVEARVNQFSDQVARRLSGEISEDAFKPLRLMNGVYLQLHAYMLRVAIPYGTLNSRQMRKLAHIARTYDRGYGHFTTRQNIQYNWPALSDMPAILPNWPKSRCTRSRHRAIASAMSPPTISPVQPLMRSPIRVPMPRF
jgi:sulfite reductase (NADPH) hemoprotein beta-component